MVSEGTDLKNRNPEALSLARIALGSMQTQLLWLWQISAQGLVLNLTDSTEAKGSQH